MYVRFCIIIIKYFFTIYLQCILRSIGTTFKWKDNTVTDYKHLYCARLFLRVPK